jgi:hypothetical protein
MGAGPVLVAGAAAVVEAAITEMDIDYDHYIVLDSDGSAEGDVDGRGAGVCLVSVAAAGRSAGDLKARVTDILAELIGRADELRDWVPRVVVRPTGALDADGAGVAPALAGATRPDDATDVTANVDAEAAALLPDGDQIARRLLGDIAYEQSVYGDAAKFAALPLEELVVDDPDPADPGAQAAAARRAAALAGCLIHASVLVIDHLFEDIHELHLAGGGASDDVEGTWILSHLPRRFATHYDAGFAHQLLVSMVEVTARLTREWTPLACVAQELGLRVVLDYVDVVADTADVELAPGWRPHLEDLLFEDADHELLFDPAMDGIENDTSIELSPQPPGMAPMRFQDWFIPFNDERPVSPYAWNTPTAV